MNVMLYVTQDAIDEALFKKYDRNNDGSLDAQEIQDLMAEMGMKAPLDEIEQHIKEAGGTNGRLTFDQLMNAVNSGM